MKPRMFNGLVYGKLYEKSWFLAPNTGLPADSPFNQFWLFCSSIIIIKQTFWTQSISYIHQHPSYSEIRFSWKCVSNQKSKRRSCFPEKYVCIIMKYKYTYFRPASKIALPVDVSWFTSFWPPCKKLTCWYNGDCPGSKWELPKISRCSKLRSDSSKDTSLPNFIVATSVSMNSMQCAGSNASGGTIISLPVGHWICGSPSFQVRASATSVVGQSHSWSSRFDSFAIQRSPISYHSQTSLLWV